MFGSAKKEKKKDVKEARDVSAEGKKKDKKDKEKSKAKLFKSHKHEEQQVHAPPGSSLPSFVYFRSPWYNVI
jgi:hypothetical protein